MRLRPRSRWVMLATWLALAATRGWAADAPPAEPGVRYVYLVRHGDYDREDKVDDRVGNGLNALGHEQARIIGERLAKLPVKMAALVSSDFTRARETAADISRALGIVPTTDSLLHECTPASERATHEDAPAAVALCDSNLQAAWAKYFHPSPDTDSYDVLVCHGNVIRWFVLRALAQETRNWRRMSIANGSLTVITVQADGATRLASYSDTGHLPTEKQTWTGRGAGWTPKPNR